jgi:ankyrin repeat protein
MGCSNSIRSSKSPIITKPNQVIDSKLLIEACRSGDINRVTVLLKTISLSKINKADWTTGNTPLHLATYYGHIDIVRLLLNHGAMRNISNYEIRIPANYASTTEMKNLFQRSTNDNSTRFVGDDSNEEKNEEIEWSLNSLDATQFFMEYESGMSYTGQWDINQTVEALQKAPELKNI